MNPYIIAPRDMPIHVKVSTDGRSMTCIPTPMMTSNEAAEYAGLTQSAFLRLYKQGEIVRRLPLRGKGFHVDDINTFLDSYKGLHSVSGTPRALRDRNNKRIDVSQIASLEEIDKMYEEGEDDGDNISD